MTIFSPGLILLSIKLIVTALSISEVFMSTLSLVPSKIKVPPIFSLTGKLGDIPEIEMFRVFNMGVGLVIIVDKNDVDAVLSADSEAVIIGEAIAGKKKVVF